MRSDWWSRVWGKWKARIGGIVAGGGIFWSAVQRAQDAEWLAGKGLRVRAWLGGLSERPWGDDLLAFLASPFAPLLVITIGVALVAWAAFQAKSEGAAPVAPPKSAQRNPAPTAPLSAPPSPPTTPTESYAPPKSPATRQTKVAAMTLAGEIRAWADRWDGRPVILGSDFDIASEFQSQFGARLEAIEPFVSTLILYKMGVLGGFWFISDTDVARRIASELDMFAMGLGF